MGTRTISAALVLAAGLLLAPVATSAARRPARTTVIHVIEHADTDTTTDTGASGDSAGDILTFHNQLFDQRDRKVVGRDQGYCIRISPEKAYECNWTAFLAGGQITVEGPFFDKADSTLAITGGTGRYRRARGEMQLRSLDDGKKFDFIYRLAR